MNPILETSHPRSIKYLKSVVISKALSEMLVVCGVGGGGSISAISTTTTSGARAIASNCALSGSVSGIHSQN